MLDEDLKLTCFLRMSSSKTVKDVDHRWRDVVFGYIRLFNVEKMIPTDICYICLLFYHLGLSYEHWLRPRLGMEIIHKNKQCCSNKESID